MSMYQAEFIGVRISKRNVNQIGIDYSNNERVVGIGME